MAQISCKYHPDRPAVWNCKQCEINFCLSCITVAGRDAVVQCPVCQTQLERIGAANLITPFWRRMSRFYLYPLSPHPLVFMLIIALLTMTVGIPLVGLVVPVLLFIVFFKYAYAALEKTAQGHMEAPEVNSETLTEELELPFKQIFLMFALLTVNMTVLDLLGTVPFTISMALTIFALPASTMILAIEHSFLKAFNPAIISLFIRRIGVSYLILCGFLLLLLIALNTAVNLLAGLVPDFLAAFVVALMTMYFFLIMFHMMGYVIYQFHEDLHYEIEVEAHTHLQAKESVEAPNPELAEVEILLQEGKMDAAKERLAIYIKSSPGDLDARRRYHRLLRATRDNDALCRHANVYLSRLLLEKKAAQAVEVYLEVQKLVPEYKPADPKIRLQLAKLLKHGANARLALHLLNHYHRDFPNHAAIPEAYLLAAQVMCENFGEDSKASGILEFVSKTYPGNPLQEEIEKYQQIIDQLGKA